MTSAVPLSKRLRWQIEYGAARAVFALFGALSVDGASALGSRLLRAIGPRLRAHKIARRNLEKVFPNKSTDEIDQILSRMWDNLGRTFGELPHLAEISNPASGRTTVIGLERLEHARDDGIGGLFFSAHFANWEIVPWTAQQNVGLASHPFFRAPNNPLMESLFRRLRDGCGGEPLPKGRQGAKRSVALLKQGEHLAMLVDQKMNDGIETNFMGHPAMTAPALATFALKFNLPVIPIHAIRQGGARFKIITEAPLALPNSGNRDQDIATLMATVNQTIAHWVEEAPEQWLWVHRRWK
jgi:KDO2-lipid IV(A) lauroyltransferase